VLGGREGSGSYRLAVALDRRVWCRVDRGVSGIVVRSKDTLRRLEAASLHELPASARGDSVIAALEAAGVTREAGVETHVRVPEGSGLATEAALSVAVIAACLPAPESTPERIAVLVAKAGVESRRPLPAVAVQAALRGGAQLQRGEAAAEPLALDPARLEECLLLVDAGPAGASLEAGVDDVTAASVLEALGAGRYADVGGLLAGAQARQPAEGDPSAERIRSLAQEAGGAAWRCRGGRIMAVWAAPGTRGAGPREEAIARLQKAGLRPFPARVDARGLELD
jgi:hypothetical protein